MKCIASLLACVIALSPATVTSQEATARFGGGSTTFLLRSTTDIAIMRPMLERFASLNTELDIVYEQWGSNALFARSRSDCQEHGPQADAIISSAIQHMVWLVNAACAQSYRSTATSALTSSRRWRDELWGISTEPAVIAFNTRLLKSEDVPRSRFALLDALRAEPERYRGKVATYDISASGLGYLFAYSDSLEATTFGALMEGFARVDAVDTCCSAEIISGVAQGKYLIAYNVLGSYVTNASAPDVGVIFPEDYTLVLSRGYMIPKGAEQSDAAENLLEFLLTPEAKGLMAQAGLVTELNASETGLAPSARRSIPLSPVMLVALDTNRREQLLRFWRDTFPKDIAP